jgi:uroporphyrinogen-III synthase
MEGNMLALEAGTKPHIITRPCRNQADAEWWAHELIKRGFVPVLIDGVRFEPDLAQAKAA